MTKTVRECDEHLGYLLDKIDANENLRKNLHLIIASDHGMEQINGTDNPIYLDDYVDSTKIQAFGSPTAMNIFVQPCKINLINRDKLVSIRNR
jgi:predicted AlkP superfamily pyrophosphatase or phosphodiesterase